MSNAKHFLLMKQYKEAEQAAISALRDDKLNAQYWVELGEALLQQNFKDAARKVFDRAWLLDPAASWIKPIHQALETRSNQGSRKDIDELLKVPKLTVTAAIIAKDEERSIERCLRSLKGAVDEILLIDNGSKDQTVAMASAIPEVRIIHIPWNDSFGELRNQAMEHITTDWVVWIDADEHLHPHDKTSIRQIAGIFADCHPTPILQIWQINQKGDEIHHEFSQSRMFPMRSNLKYWGRIHEQISSTRGLFEGEFYRKSVRIRVLHDGYDQPVIESKDKLNRNLRLLERMTVEDPDNPGWWLYRGRENLASGNLEQGIECLNIAAQKAEEQPKFSRTLEIYNYLTKAYMAKKDYAQAELACQKAIGMNENFPDSHFYLAQIQMLKAMELQKQAEQNLLQSKSLFSQYRGVVTADYSLNQWKIEATLGDLCRFRGKLNKAKRLYEHLLSREPQLNQVRRSLNVILKELNSGSE